MSMAAADVHPRFLVDFENAEAAAEVREEMLERGAYDDPDECGICGAETVLVDGRLTAWHGRGCPAARAHLRLVEDPPCEHEHLCEEAGYPDRSGRCDVHAVCEDCRADLGHVGWDSVL